MGVWMYEGPGGAGKVQAVGARVSWNQEQKSDSLCGLTAAINPHQPK